MISDILSLYQKNIALSRALESQKSSMGDSDSNVSGMDDGSSRTDFSALLEQAAKATEKLADSKRASAPAAKPSAAVTSSGSPVSAKPARMKDGIDKKSDLYQQCQEFESIFVKQMLDAMRKTVDKSGLTDNGMGQDIFEDMLYDEYAKTMSKTANFGIADTMYRQLSNLRPATSIAR